MILSGDMVLIVCDGIYIVSMDKSISEDPAAVTAFVDSVSIPHSPMVEAALTVLSAARSCTGGQVEVIEWMFMRFGGSVRAGDPSAAVRQFPSKYRRDVRSMLSNGVLVFKGPVLMIDPSHAGSRRRLEHPDLHVEPNKEIARYAIRIWKEPSHG